MPDAITHNAVTCACKNGPGAGADLEGLEATPATERRVPDDITHNAATSACENGPGAGADPEGVEAMPGTERSMPDAITHNAATSACENGPGAGGGKCMLNAVRRRVAALDGPQCLGREAADRPSNVCGPQVPKG